MKQTARWQLVQVSIVADLSQLFNSITMRSYHSFLILVGVLLLQSLSSCRLAETTMVGEVNPKSPVTVQSTDYYPLEVGNEWWYKPDSTINFVDHYNGNVIRVVAERKVGNTMEYDLTDSILDRYGSMEQFTVVKEGNKVWRKSTFAPDGIDWLIDFSATSATSDKDKYGFIQERMDSYKVYAGEFKDNVRIFFPAAAYDGLPLFVVAKGIGPIAVLPFGIPTNLNKAKIGGVKYGNW